MRARPPTISHARPYSSTRRRTGITLNDTGLRDEHGLEPVSGIFSSPIASPERAINNGNTVLDSSDMVLQESMRFEKHTQHPYHLTAIIADMLRNPGSVPDITETLNLRRTPHLPPKSPGPRHTNIGGSPVRQSSVRPESPNRQSSPTHPLSAQASSHANRLLDFSTQEPRPTLNQSPSPFKPRPAKSARAQRSRKSLFEFIDTPGKRADNPKQTEEEDEKLDKTVQEVVDQLVEDATDAFADRAHSAPVTEDTSIQDRGADGTESASEWATEFVTEAAAEDAADDATEAATEDATEAATEAATTTNFQQAPKSTRKTSRARRSDGSSHNTLEIDANGSPAMTASSSNQKRKRGRPRTSGISTLTGAEDDEQAGPAQKRRRSSVNETSIIDTTELSVPDETVNDTTLAPQGPTSAQKKKNLAVHQDEDENAEHEGQDLEETQSNASFEDFQPPPEDDMQEPETDPVQEPPKKHGRAKAQKRGSQREPTNRDTSANVRATRSPGQLHRDSESVDPEGKKRGPRSLVQLRAGTPMEDDGATQTRSGRTSIKPLKYWQNETYVWDHGEINAVVRASEIAQPKKQVNRNTGRRKGKPTGSKLTAIQEDDEEEDEDEELLPEAWEEEMGVINGEVRGWDAEIGAGNPDEVVSEGMSLPFRNLDVFEEANSDRPRICINIYRNPRRPELGVPLRQSLDFTLLWIRHGRNPTLRFQAYQKLTENANGLLLARRKSHSRSSRPQIRHDQRRSLASSKRYVLIFPFSFHLLYSTFPTFSDTSHAFPPRPAMQRNARRAVNTPPTPHRQPDACAHPCLPLSVAQWLCTTAVGTNALSHNTRRHAASASQHGRLVCSRSRHVV